MVELASQLKIKGAALGFDLIGVAAAGPVDDGGALECWLGRGMHGEMEYMHRTASLRRDPRSLLPGCRSVIAVAMSYHTSLPASTAPGPPGTAWVSRYAWGRDYHGVVKKRLVQLGRWLQSQAPGSRWRACVDTAPAAERWWAARAGLGWIGKSTMLLNRHLGSELFLGLLLSDLRLAPDEPVASHCGRCTSCLDACPTGAFPTPHVLDARKCIAYLTIEHRGAIPTELRPGMADMIAGCDVCQEVCPWNRRARVDLHPEFLPAPHRYRPQVADLETLDDRGWRFWRRGSALNRVSYEQLRRNLEVARSNQAVI